MRVTNVELFFDLVYVFAITQLSDYLFEHPSVRGALQTLVMFTAVWWAWNYTAWRPIGSIRSGPAWCC